MSSIKHHEDISLEDVARVKNALDPVDPQDYVTKSYGDTNYGGGATNIDGGFAASVYLSTQNINGGDANG